MSTDHGITSNSEIPALLLTSDVKVGDTITCQPTIYEGLRVYTVILMSSGEKSIIPKRDTIPQ
jgi:hypothetical protein